MNHNHSISLCSEHFENWRQPHNYSPLCPFRGNTKANIISKITYEHFSGEPLAGTLSHTIWSPLMKRLKKNKNRFARSTKSKRKIHFDTLSPKLK